MSLNLQKLYNICFEDSKTFSDFLFKKKFRKNNALFIRDGESVVSMLFTVPKTLNLSGVKISCPYISGVCTHPDYRKRGYAESLMNDAHKKLEAEGHCICALHPFRHSFYQKMGYNTYTRVREYKIPAQKSAQDIYEYRTAQAEDVKLLLELYKEFTAVYSGYVVRGLRQMRYMFKELTCEGTIDIISLAGKDIGYAAYDNGGFMAEFCCADEGALLANPRYHGMTANLPLNSTLGSITDFTMIKILSRTKFLREMGYTDISRFKDVSDDELIKLVAGSYHDFGLIPPKGMEDVFAKRCNYVFDKF